MVRRAFSPRILAAALGLALLIAASDASAHPTVPESLRRLDAQLSLTPDDGALWLRRAEIQIEDATTDVADLDTIEADAARAEQLGADGSRLVRLRARIDGARGDSAAAQLRLAAWLAEHPDDVPTRLMQAAALRRLGRTAEEAAALSIVVASTPHPSPDVVLRLVEAQRAIGCTAEAEATLRVAIERLGAVPALLQARDAATSPAAAPARRQGDCAHPALPSPTGGRRDRSFAKGAPTTVTRGPYLQRATPTSIVVRWRTGNAVDTRLRFGLSSGALDQVVDDPTVTTEHVVVITGLDPATAYDYQLATSVYDFAAQPGQTFRTPPLAGSHAAQRIWVLGDSGTAGANAAAVRDSFDAWSVGHPPDLWLMLGDNAYTSGTDLEYQAAVFDIYAPRLRSAPLWPTLGNHDGASADSATQTGPYYDIFTLPAAAEAGGVVSGTEAYYSFDVGNVHFVCLDSHETSRSPGGAMLLWLAADLAATEAAGQADWTIAFWHHPPYSKGSHDSDVETQLVQMRENVLPILEAHGVDLVLAGHSHSYERSLLLDGHYGDSTSLAPSMVLDAASGDPAGTGPYCKDPRPNDGTVYAVAGSSGQTTAATLDHPAMIVGLVELGSLVLDIQGLRLDGTFLSAAGAELDHFAIVKGIFADGFESGSTSAWSAVVP